jgi:hypothetical protein
MGISAVLDGETRAGLAVPLPAEGTRRTPVSAVPAAAGFPLSPRKMVTPVCWA